jgi:dolichyldiphosphatase
VRQSKWLVAGSLAFAAIWKRDAEIMWFLLGAVGNSLLSMVLKKMLNHERPAPALRSGPGMPSSHAQSIFYAATILALSCKNFRKAPVFSFTLIMIRHDNTFSFQH